MEDTRKKEMEDEYIFLEVQGYEQWKARRKMLVKEYKDHLRRKAEKKIKKKVKRFKKNLLDEMI